MDEYQNFRGRKFTAEEYRMVSASADYLIAIIARFEHCGDKGVKKPYQELLKSCGGESFLYS